MDKSFTIRNLSRPASLVGILTVMAMILAACAPAAAIIPAQTPTASTSSSLSIDVATDPSLGQYLVNSAGMSLYAFSKDLPGKSNCTGGCLTKWPPLVTQGSASVASGLDASLVGSAALADGTQIVTYNNIPLYTFAGDTKPGDTTGQGFGGLWYVVSPAGQVINK